MSRHKYLLKRVVDAERHSKKADERSMQAGRDAMSAHDELRREQRALDDFYKEKLQAAREEGAQ